MALRTCGAPPRVRPGQPGGATGKSPTSRNSSRRRERRLLSLCYDGGTRGSRGRVLRASLASSSGLGLASQRITSDTKRNAIAITMAAMQQKTKARPPDTKLGLPERLGWKKDLWYSSDRGPWSLPSCQDQSATLPGAVDVAANHKMLVLEYICTHH